LEALHKRWHAAGLEVIGINLDAKAETGAKVCKSLALTYPQAWVPREGRDLWEAASGIRGVPRVLLIDRDGILRADGPANLEEQVAKLLAARPK